jgi:hypothetical protein
VHKASGESKKSLFINMNIITRLSVLSAITILTLNITALPTPLLIP